MSEQENDVPDVQSEPEPTPEPEATPVIARQPSSASPTQAPESAPEPEAQAPSLEDAARNVIALVRAHRTAGDSDLDAALVSVERALEQSA